MDNSFILLMDGNNDSCIIAETISVNPFWVLLEFLEPKRIDRVHVVTGNALSCAPDASVTVFVESEEPQQHCEQSSCNLRPCYPMHDMHNNTCVHLCPFAYLDHIYLNIRNVSLEICEIIF